MDAITIVVWGRGLVDSFQINPILQCDDYNKSNQQEMTNLHDLTGESDDIPIRSKRKCNLKYDPTLGAGFSIYIYMFIALITQDKSAPI